MYAALRDEADALAKLPTHKWRSRWSINPDAGTVTELPNGALIAYLHPLAISNGGLLGWWFLPHDKGTT